MRYKNLTEEDDPINACLAGDETHPKYGKCLECPSAFMCELPLKRLGILKALQEDSDEETD